MSNSSAKSEQISKIIKCRNDALNQLQSDVDQLNARANEINKKVTDGGVMTDAEKAERNGLRDSVDSLVAIETHVLLFSVSALDSTAQVKILIGQVDSANKELEDVKKSVEALSKTIKDIGDFLKSLSGLLTNLTGLLAAVA
jgi:prefoldin subunit 5